MAASEKWHYCRDRVEGQKRNEHKRPIRRVEVGGGLSSLRPPEINGGGRCSASDPIRSKYLYARLQQVRSLIDGGL